MGAESINISMDWCWQGHAYVGAIPIAPIFRQLSLVFCVENKALEHGYGTNTTTLWILLKIPCEYYLE